MWPSSGCCVAGWTESPKTPLERREMKSETSAEGSREAEPSEPQETTRLLCTDHSHCHTLWLLGLGLGTCLMAV